MIRFLDGPAEGRSLFLRSAPDFLRVTYLPGRTAGVGRHKKLAEWDALDQPLDAPEPGETIYVYRRVTKVEAIHVNMRPHGSGFYAVADYMQMPDDGERFRNQVEWARFMREEPFEEPTAAPFGDRDDAIRRVQEADRQRSGGGV